MRAPANSARGGQDDVVAVQPGFAASVTAFASSPTSGMWTANGMPAALELLAHRGERLLRFFEVKIAQRPAVDELRHVAPESRSHVERWISIAVFLRELRDHVPDRNLRARRY